ncbi:MAG: PD-(D/E)XK nuclease family protein, partial [Planctomycetota bacterium]
MFSPTERTYVALVEMIKKCKLKLDEPLILKDAVRFSSSAQLAHIEKQVFEFEPAKILAGDSVRVVSAPNSRAEVRFVARQILQLVQEKGYRYRDIAVIASDIESYQHYIRAYFEDYGIPFFIDKKKVLNQHAVVRLICSALEVIGGGFSSSDVFAYLKNDLVPIERRDVDVLENYCVGFGISGEDWQSDREWLFAGEQSDEFQEERVNQIRAEAISPLVGLRKKLCPRGNLKKTIGSEEFTQSIFDFLDELDVCGKLSEWIEEASERQDFAGADEHRQFYDKLVDVFDELAAAFEGQKLSCEDYLAIVNSAFSQLALAFIPLGLDQVLVGSIERSRHPDLKVVFLVGATQRQFPVPVGGGGILTDEDRIAAESADFALAATRSEELAERQYLAYIAFTRGSEYLYVTYPVADEKGKVVARSEFAANLESLFEDFEEESIAGEKIPVDRLYNEAELAGLLCSELGRDVSRCSMLDAGCSLEASRKQFGELLDDMCADEKLAELSATVLSAINYDNVAKLDKRVVEQLFGEQIECSVTELGSFAACGYQHFARYVLELKERKEFKLEPLDLGVFEHKVLDGLLKKLKVKKKDFATVERGELLKFLRGVIAELIGMDSFIANFIHRSRYNTFIVGSASEVLEDCVLAIDEMVRAGIFRPMWSEISFGKGKELGEYKIGLSGGRVLALDGKIDRLDIAEVGGDKIAAVFDYKKRRDIPFGWTRFYYGLDMQLPIYLLAVRNASAAQYKVKDVAGAFYMPVEVSPKTGTFDELSTKEGDFDYKARGVFNGQFFKQFDSQARS